MPDVVLLTLGFGLVCLASHRVGKWFTSIGLPYITGYLGIGALAGTFGVNLLATEDAEALRFVDEISLAVIAFVAGSELHASDLKGRLRQVGGIAGGIVGSGVVLLGLAIFALTGFLAFAEDLDFAGRVATAALGAAVLLALSPPSTIAVIKDVRARGPFTSSVLITTIVMDVVVVVMFAVAGSLAAALLRGGGFDLMFVVVLAIDLALALAGGILIGRVFGTVLNRPMPSALRAALVVGIGWGVFAAAGVIDTWSAANLPFEIYIEPLLLCLIAGYTVVNHTDAGDAFERVLHDVSPAVYVAFFTLTGLSLKLDLLVQVLPAAAALFLVRIAVLYVGTQVGARLGGASEQFRQRSWMAFVTQAGIALGLAREATNQFAELGDSFATLIVSVVVLNEVFGPLFLAAALRRAGEAAGGDEGRAVTLFGVEPGTLELAGRLARAGWTVHVLADGDDQPEVTEDLPIDVRAVDVEHIRRRPMEDTGIPNDTDVIVVMSSDPDANLVVARAAHQLGVGRIVASAPSLTHVADFEELDALVLDPVSAMLGLLEESVVSPRAVDLVLHADPNRDTTQVTVAESRVIGLSLRELRLPVDALVVAIDRDGQTLTPDGAVRLRRGDEVTLVGSPDALAEVRVRLGY